MNKIFLIIAIVFSGMLMQAQKVFNYDDVADKKVKGNIEKYMTESGVEFSLGDTLRIGYPHRNDAYDFLQHRGRQWTGAMAGGTTGTMTSTEAGHIIVLKMMKATGRKLYVTTSAKGESLGVNIINFEEAFKTGEVVKIGHLSPDEALAKLEKAKTKLDLGVITQEKYEEIKTELLHFIN